MESPATAEPKVEEKEPISKMESPATAEPKVEEKEEPISKHEFFFESALYKEFKIGEIEDNWHKGEVEAYNPMSHKDTTYTISYDSMGMYSHYPNLGKVTLTCKRDSDSELYFFIYYDKEKIYKCGQEPSLADIQYAEIGRKYDKLLSENDLKELKRAIGLAAHGAGIASYVHLRRIFENLIAESFTAHKATLGISDEVFQSKKMVGKVETLKEFLPSQLIEFQVIYGILSLGIHELDEDVCLQYFSIIKLAVILILEQKVEMEAKRKRDEDAKKVISEISSQVSKKP